jgi:mRNA interferase MazF
VVSSLRVQVVQLTSNTSRLFSFEAYVMVQGKQSKAMADQVMTADKQRLSKKLDTLTEPEMREIGRALRLQLGL